MIQAQIYQLIANGKGSYDDFGIYIRNRNIPGPVPKKALESVPFKNGSYDFSRITGELAFDDLVASYSFDIAEMAVSEMQAAKDEVVRWLIGCQDTDITDEYIQAARGDQAVLHGSLDSFEWEEDGSQGLLTAAFRCYPYKLLPHRVIALEAGGAVSFQNPSDHRVVPTLNKDPGVGRVITPNGPPYSFAPLVDAVDTRIEMLPGPNTWTVEGSGVLRVKFRPEVF